MPTTPNYIIDEIVDGRGQLVNSINSALQIIDIGMGSYLEKNVSGGVDVTLTSAEWQRNVIAITGTLTANISLIVPSSQPRVFVLLNLLSGGFSLTVRTASGTFPASILSDSSASLLCCDGAGVFTITTRSSGSFTATGTGFTDSVTGTAYWVKIGRMVSLYIPELSGTSNSTGFTLTGVPGEIQTPNGGFIPVLVEDNGVNAVGYVQISISTDTISVGLFPNGAFTASGAKTLFATWINYSLP